MPIRIKLYNTALFLFFPVVILWFIVRILTGKEDKKRYLERFGVMGDNIDSEGTFCLWINAVSVGEVKAALQFLPEFSNKLKSKVNKDINVVITTTTLTSTKIVEKYIESNQLENIKITHQFFPIDFLSFVRKFLSRLKPDLILFFDSEIWPNIMLESKKYTDNFFIVNARMSSKSFNRWAGFSGLFRLITQNVKKFYPSSAADHRKFKSLLRSDEKIGNIYNSKFDIDATRESISNSINISQISEISQNIGNKFVFMLASSHPGEEKIALEAFAQLKRSVPKSLFILALRHPVRTKEVLHLIKRKFPELTIMQRSTDKMPSPECDIFIVDTMGELGIFYNLSHCILVGGSLVKHIGGHNVMEPIISSRALVMTGIYYDNFQDIIDALAKEWAILIVRNKDHLAEWLITIHKKPQIIETVNKNLETFLPIYQNIIKNLSADICSYLEG